MTNQDNPGDLPPLPEPHWPRYYFGGVPSGAYTADQMHAYARAAVAQFAADAERYRFLLSGMSDWAVCEWDHDSCQYVGDSRAKAIIDADIDAAIGGKP